MELLPPPAVQKKASKTAASDSHAVGAALVSRGLLTPAQLHVCMTQLAASTRVGSATFLEQIIVQNRFVSRDAMSQALDLEMGPGQTTLFQTLLPIQVCRRYHVFPLRLDRGVLQLKTCGPLTDRQLESIKGASEVEIIDIKIIPTDRVDIAESLSRMMKNEHTFDVMLEKLRHQEISGGVLKQAIQTLLTEALELRASDIHLDRVRDPYCWVSHRVDGGLRQTHLIPEKIMAAIFTRIKSEAGMDASDSGRAQDGRLTLPYSGRVIDFRVATQATVAGETMTMRVLDPEALQTLDSLFPNQPQMRALFNRMAAVKGKNGGLIIFSGPTGSGKTTSLYALAQRVPRDSVNVLTVEDPVEYVLAFSRQIQLNQLRNEKSTSVERSILRQDPDIVILGEIRDENSMSAALKFSESGHTVLASIHSNDTSQTFERILSYASEDTKQETLYMLANTLRVIVNQRLVRRLCSCSVSVGADRAKGQRRAVGCIKCQGTGYLGRVAAHETLVLPSDELGRAKITKLLFASVENFPQVKSVEGGYFQSRGDTLNSLVESGIVDTATRDQTLDTGLLQQS